MPVVEDMYWMDGQTLTCSLQGTHQESQTGYPALHWKSNVKLANLQALGVPVICGPEVSCKEFGSGAEHWVTGGDDPRSGFSVGGALRTASKRRRSNVQGHAYPDKRSRGVPEMANTVEVLISPRLQKTAGPMLRALYQTILKQSDKVQATTRYAGGSDCLVLYGVGAVDRIIARDLQLAKGGRVIMWDQGYFGKKRFVGYLRVSIDHPHPQGLLDITPNNPERWDVHNIPLREDYDEKGPVILVGLGPKTHAYLGEAYDDWERDRYRELLQRFPKSRIVYRPKPRRAHPQLGCYTDGTSPIEDLLLGASLVVVRHSNVAVDAVIAGVPFECEEGAAMWLTRKEYTPENRLDFLRRLSYWQWATF